MADAIAKLLEAVDVLADEAKVLALAVEAMHAACGRGVAFGATSRGHPRRLGHFHAMKDGAPLALAIPHVAFVRTPAIDVLDVPPEQRNRWVEPFREGIATPESFKSSSMYPVVKALGVLDQGRVCVCAGAKQVALVGAAIPEGTAFSDAERARLTEVAAAIVAPLRMAALVAAGSDDRQHSPLEVMLDSAEEAIVTVDARGAIVDSSPVAASLLRRDRGVAARVRSAVRSVGRDVGVVRSPAEVLRVSRCRADRRVAYLVVIDGSAWAEPPVALSPRQRELLASLRRGLTNAEIADGMGVAPSTVKTMLERLYAKAGVSNRVELLAWADARDGRVRG